MAKQFDRIGPDHCSFIEAQSIFFSGSAGPDGRVNVSPKGMDSLRVLSETRIIWLNFTGSGNETAAHVVQNPRNTLMWCSFSRRPQILRCFGAAQVLHRDHPDWPDLVRHFGDPLGARQIFDVAVDLVQTSCGYAVPLMDTPTPRDTLEKWTVDKGPEGLRDYWDTRNRQTIDGYDTGIKANLT